MHYASRWLPFLVRCSRCTTKDSSSGRIIHHVPVMRLKTRKSTTCLLKFFQPEGFEHNNGQRYEIVWGGWYLISRSSLFILNVAVNFPLLCTLKENNFETLSIDLSCTQFSPVVLWTAGPCDLFLSYELKDIYERRIALGGGGVLPYISHIGMCHPKGYDFCTILVWKEVETLPILAWNSLWCPRLLWEGMNVIVVSVPFE